MTLIFITHDIALASNLADDIAVFKSGHLVEAGKVYNVLPNPGSVYTRRLLSSHLDLTTPPLIGLQADDPVLLSQPSFEAI